MQPQVLKRDGGHKERRCQASRQSGLVFDYIFSRLQGDLQKSLESGAVLHNLTGALNDVHNTPLVSWLFTISFIDLINYHLISPPNVAPYPKANHPYDLPHKTTKTRTTPNPPHRPLHQGELQSQLHDTQTSLANHVDKMTRPRKRLF
jgi:hypothetical protein